MKGLNKVSLIGNLGGQPEIQYLEDNIVVAKFSMATTETFKDKSGENHHTTEWHSVVAWRGLAEFADKYLKKGSHIYLEGKIKYRNFEDKAGNKRYVTEIVAEEIILLDKKNDEINLNN